MSTLLRVFAGWRFAGRVLASTTLLLCVSAHAETSGPAEDERLAAFYEQIFQRNLANSPLFQSQIGMKGADYGKWDDFSDRNATLRNDWAREDLDKLHADFDRSKLSAQSRVSYRIFEFLQQRALRMFPWRFHQYAFSSMGNTVSFMLTFLQNTHRIDDVADAQAYISRLQGTEAAMGQVIEDIDTAASRGIVPTSFSFDLVLKDSRDALSGRPFEQSDKDSPLLADFRAKVTALEIDEAQKQQLIGQAVAALQGPVRTAFERYIAKVESLRAKSPGPNGVWTLPDGAAFYRAQVDFWTTDATLDADQVHELGLAEVARIRAEMEGIMRKLEFKGELPEFFTFLRTDPGNFFPNTDAGRQAYLEQSKAYIDSIYADVDKYFRILPKAPLEVRKVEAWREATAPIAFYERPTPDGSRPGIYYVNLMDMSTNQKHEMETVAYHEGAPGHHFQVAVQQELTGVPMFQKFAFFGAYVEGWGLYAERLAKEEGRFTDPMQDFGRLQNEMLRAVRLVVDTGAHSRKWTREQMIDYMLANNPMTPESVAKEVERYIDMPGQALSYKVGMEKILALRAKAKAELGEDFDIRDFHDTVLRNGAVALPILAELVDDYIAAKKR